MKKWKNSIFLLLFLIGLGLILYPIVSSKVEDWSHSKAIADYRSQVAEKRRAAGTKERGSTGL